MSALRSGLCLICLSNIWHRWSQPIPHCSCSVAKSCPTLCDLMDCSTSGFPVLHYLPEFAQTSIVSMMPSNHLILCHPLFLLPSIFPSIRVFSCESALPIRWPKYWSFSFSISPSLRLRILGFCFSFPFPMQLPQIILLNSEDSIC